MLGRAGRTTVRNRVHRPFGQRNSKWNGVKKSLRSTPGKIMPGVKPPWIRSNYFQRHGPVRGHLPSAVDNPHAAHTQFLQQLVVPKHLRCE